MELEVRTVPIDEVKARVEELVNDAVAGRATIITRAGVTVARLLPAREPEEMSEQIPLLERARRLRERIGPGESAAEMIRQARHEAGRT